MPVENRRTNEPRISLVAPENAQRFIERYGSIADAAARQVAVAAVQRLLTDQKRLRTRLHELQDSPNSERSGLSAAERDELETLRRDNEDLEARLPKTGEVVLSADDAKLWEAYKALGKPDDIKTAVTEFPKLSEKVSTSERLSLADQAADALKYNRSALREIVTDKGLQLEIKTETVDGKPVSVPYIRERDAAKDSAPVKLSEYAKTKLGAYSAALAAPNAAANGDSTSDIAGHRTAGVEYFAQDSGGGTAPTGTPAERFIAERDKRNAQRTNPLIPQTSNK